MKKSPQKIKLQNLANSDKSKVAEEVICIPTSLYLEMIRIIKSIPATNGRVEKLLPQLPKT